MLKQRKVRIRNDASIGRYTPLPLQNQLISKEKWRWARDSNPGTAINRRRFSRPLHSATLPAHRLTEKRQKAYFSCCRCDSGWNDTGFAITVNALKKKRWKFHWFWSRCEQDYTSLMESIGAFSVVND